MAILPVVSLGPAATIRPVGGGKFAAVPDTLTISESVALARVREKLVGDRAAPGEGPAFKAREQAVLQDEYQHHEHDDLRHDLDHVELHRGRVQLPRHRQHRAARRNYKFDPSEIWNYSARYSPGYAHPALAGIALAAL